MKFLYSILVLAVISLGLKAAIDSQEPSSPHRVLVMVEAKPERAEELKTALQKVQRLSLQEPTCLEYEIRQPSPNSNIFLLCELWTSAAEHQLQFQKPYILELIGKLDGLLAKPYMGFDKILPINIEK